MTAQASTTAPAVLDAIEHLGRLTALFQERREQLAREAGLTVGQWQLLEEISEEHFMPSLFARRNASSPAAVSKVLRQLLDKGLIEVSISARDGRQRDYELSGAGRERLARLRAGRERAVEAVWSDLDPNEVVAFARYSATLAERLAAYAERHKR